MRGKGIRMSSRLLFVHCTLQRPRYEPAVTIYTFKSGCEHVPGGELITHKRRTTAILLRERASGTE